MEYSTLVPCGRGECVSAVLKSLIGVGDESNTKRCAAALQNAPYTQCPIHLHGQ